MAWTRQVRGRLVIDFEVSVDANRDDMAREIAKYQICRQFGLEPLMIGDRVQIEEVIPAGDWCGVCVGACQQVHTEEQQAELDEYEDNFIPIHRRRGLGGT